MRSIWRRYNDLSRPRSPDNKEKKIKHGDESGPGETQIIATQLKQKMLRDLTLMIYSWTPRTRTHKHTHGTECDGLNKAKGVCTDGSIQILPFKRHHVPTYVCNTDDRINKSGWPLRPTDDLSHWIFSETMSHQSQTWTRLPKCRCGGNEADFFLFQAIQKKKTI